MSRPKYSITIVQQSIFGWIDDLHQVLLKGQANTETRKQHDRDLRELDANNEDFHDISTDHVLDFKNKLYILAVVLICCIDYFLMLNGMTILCERFHLPTYFKWFVPSILIIVEIIFSFMNTAGERNGTIKSSSSKVLQYFVITILAGVSVLACVYAVAGYNPEFDSESFSKYSSGVILYQIILFVASLFSHIWLIKHSEHIVMAFAYLRYKFQRGALVSKIKSIDAQNRDSYTPQFKKKVVALVKMIEDYNRKYPEWPVDFSQAITVDLRGAINVVMGRNVFVFNNWNDRLNNPNSDK